MDRSSQILLEADPDSLKVVSDEHPNNSALLAVPVTNPGSPSKPFSQLNGNCFGRSLSACQRRRRVLCCEYCFSVLFSRACSALTVRLFPEELGLEFALRRVWSTLAVVRFPTMRSAVPGLQLVSMARTGSSRMRLSGCTTCCYVRDSTYGRRKHASESPAAPASRGDPISEPLAAVYR